MGAHRLPSVWALALPRNSQARTRARTQARSQTRTQAREGSRDRQQGPGRHLKGAGAVWTPGPRGEPRQLALRLGGHVLQ